MCKVQISDRVTPFKFIVDSVGLDLIDDNISFSGDILIEGEIIKGSQAFEIKGKIECQRQFTCDRCLTETTDKQLIEFDEELENIEDNIADLTEVIRDNILAAQPVKNLCKSDCKGLCPVCGQNLNEKECSCDTFIFDPRLDALKKFFNAESEE